jgi:hypothetical protein
MPARDLRERFDEKYVVDTKSGCWIWTDHRNRDGYGVINVQGSNKLAHRVAYELLVGQIPPDKHVLHKCDNPWCVNPLCLWLGTDADNVADRDAKGRQARGDTHGIAVLNEQTAAEVKWLGLYSHYSCRVIGERYGIGQSAVDHILHGRRWANVQPIKPDWYGREPIWRPTSVTTFERRI